MATTDTPQTDGGTELIGDNEVVMTPTQKRFYASEYYTQARTALEAIVDSPQYDTESSYYSTSDLCFIDRHLYYLSTHPATNLIGYITNLKLMTSLKQRS